MVEGRSGQAAPTVRHLRHLRVPLRDGGWLSAALFYPAHMAGAIERGERPPESLPALLEYHPYRKGDGRAGRGYVSAQLDVRGTGDSPGVARDEYLPREHEDGYDAVEWLAAQPWCSGAVGMWGTSYAGFTAIQVAMLRPPSLRAIAPHAATDDRYTDDVPYDGGCLMCLDALPYPLSQLALDALPPNPAHMAAEGEDWMARWRERLGTEPWLLRWLRHQTRDDFWRHGSLRADYDAIRCPTYLISGWHDGYVRATLRAFRELRRRGVPTKALVGPWTHSRSDESGVGPRIDFVHELTRWCDHWLKHIPTGVIDEPPASVYLQDSHPPHRHPDRIPGRWRFFGDWSPGGVEEHVLPLRVTASGRVPPDPTVGTAGPAWCPTEEPFGLGDDQRADEERSLTFELGPFETGLTLLGRPEAVLFAAAEAKMACVVAKLSDVGPDGSSTLITRAALNDAHRRRRGVSDPHAKPAPLVPGQVVELRLALRDTGCA